MFNSEEEYNAAMQAEAEHDMEMAAQAAEGEAEQVRINAEAVNSGLNTLLAGIIYNLEYAAYNLLDGKKYTDLPKGIMESTGPGDSLLMAIRDLKEIAS